MSRIRSSQDYIFKGLKVLFFGIIVSIATTVASIIPAGLVVGIGMLVSKPVFFMLAYLIYFLVWLYMAGRIYYWMEPFLRKEGW